MMSISASRSARRAGAWCTTPFAELRHFESRSVQRTAFDALDQHRLMHRWDAMIRRDPFYNVNLRRDSQHFRAHGEA